MRLSQYQIIFIYFGDCLNIFLDFENLVNINNQSHVKSFLDIYIFFMFKKK